MKTLVIHPKDVTTDILSMIYIDRGWTVINEDIPQVDLIGNIQDHDRIVMLGHGLPMGLLGFGRLVINDSFAPLLKEKKCVAVWCNADKFFKKHGLKGFYTGMIISEMGEASMYGIYPNNDELTDSNIIFAEAVRDGIEDENMLEVVKNEYVGDGGIFEFNSQRIFYNE